MCMYPQMTNKQSNMQDKMGFRAVISHRTASMPAHSLTHTLTHSHLVSESESESESELGFSVGLGSL